MVIKEKKVTEAIYAVEAECGGYDVSASVTLADGVVTKIGGGVVKKGEAIVARFSLWNSDTTQVTYLVSEQVEQDAINAAIHELKNGMA